MSAEPYIIAHRTHVHTWDGPRGQRWRGGVVQRIEGETAWLAVLAEAGSPLIYRGPSAGLQERCPIVCRVAGAWPYRLVEVRASAWASSSDAKLAREGAPGVYGVVPFDMMHVDPVLWREDEWP